MPPTKAIVELGEAIVTSPAVKSAAEAAIKAGASLIDDFLSIGGRSIAKSAASTVNGKLKVHQFGRNGSRKVHHLAAGRFNPDLCF